MPWRSLPGVGCIIIPVPLREAVLGGGIESLLDPRDRNSNSRLILPLFLLILRKRMLKRPKTPLWCSIVDTFQRAATLAKEGYKLKHFAEQFRLAVSLI
jgi:hypothetical protein